MKHLKLDFSKMSVLVVEDTVPMRMLVVNLLEALGVGVVLTANDGLEGFETFCKNSPDVVISDWQMKPVSGVDMVKNIRSHNLSPNKMVPVIMMTGYNSFEKVGQARDIGVTEYLVKPFTAEDLARRIAYVVQKPRDFVQTPDYFGPDRRRRDVVDYAGDLRRFDDGGSASVAGEFV